MKKIILTLLFAAAPLWAEAQPRLAQLQPDTPLGPVVAVQRHITDVEAKCLGHMTGETDKPMYVFSCRVDFPFDDQAEAVITPTPMSRFGEDGCYVEINYIRGGLAIFFGNPKAPVGFDDAKACLAKALVKSQNQIDVLIFKYNVAPAAARRY